MSKIFNKVTGNFGEDFACDYLIKNNYTILERNFTSYRGELDIIASKNNEIIFIEVKTRAQSFCGEPAEAVNSHKKMRLYMVAEYYLYLHNLIDSKVRFDVIEVYIEKGFARVNHIPQIL